MKTKTFKERKIERTKKFYKYQYKKKLEVCTACNGTGFYDHNGSPKCDCCNGLGKVKQS